MEHKATLDKWDLLVILNRLGGKAIFRLEKMGDVIYSYGAERFRVCDRKGAERVQSAKS